MKILAIRGRNLASLEGFFEIDFEQEPLRSAGIFAITGPTGAGKSTLLDALSLALYDQTPRTNNTSESISIFDVKEKTINQKDSRNILRRGSTEGFAEVDFLSLRGVPYRSTWRVKRANNKVDGSLQKTDFSVVNLSDGSKLQGTKTELLEQIITLTGLTFEQFSRAVLLAQGDFSAFLKAKSNEKAELLEKLTGTDIYSRISIAIYEKAKKAKNEVELIEEKIKGVELLSEEEEKALFEEKEEIVKNMISCKKKIEIIENKLKWCKEEADLNRSEQEAQRSYNEATRLIEENKPRRELIRKIDSTQEIRDQYLQWKLHKKQLTEQKEELEKKRNEQKETITLLTDATTKWETFNKDLTKTDQEYTSIEPEIVKVRELDITSKHTKEKEEESRKILENITSGRQKISKNAEISEKKISDLQKSIENIEQWFEQYHTFAEIIDSIDLIITFAENIAAAQKQIETNRKIFAENDKLIQKDLQNLELVEEESQKLEKLLPAEISALRAKLVDGEPCPVCGSLHHPLEDSSSESKMKEDEIAKLKSQLQGKREKIAKCITDRQNDNHKISGLLQNYELQLQELNSVLSQKLIRFKGWEKLMEEGVLQDRLRKRATEWQIKKEQKEKFLAETSSLTTTLQHEKQKLEEMIREESAKREEHLNIVKQVENLKAEREKLLNGKTADEVITYFTTQKQKLKERLEKAAKVKEEALKRKESLQGVIHRITLEIEGNEKQERVLQQNMEEWLHHSGKMSMEQLAELMQYDPKVVMQEKERLEELDKKLTIAKTTWEERKKKREEHHRSLDKPSVEETSEQLQIMKNEQISANEILEKRKTTITVSLTHHEQGKVKIAQYDKLLLDKRSEWEEIERINELFGSATGAKFKAIAQGYTLDTLLKYANYHLKELSHRYELQRIPDTLALQVVDLDMLNEVRSVNSLSGGESFLVSLALALGLSSLSSNRMKIESLFIDEGFGSLDIETLRIAMDALERLQNQGRKIGVISHVAEMTERIATQIKVVKEVNGRSRLEVLGS